MKKDLKQIIESAKKSTLRYDGYGKLIIQDENGQYSFTRKYDEISLFEGERVIGEIIPYWENGTLKAKYEDRL